jgi:hypothetical protein
MLWSSLCLIVAAIQIGPLLITDSFSVLISDPSLKSFDVNQDWTLYSWVSMYQLTPSCMTAWTLTTTQGFLTLCKQQTGDLQVCFGATCVSSSGTAALFYWEFVSVSMSSSHLKICSSRWSPRSLSCASVQISALTLDSASSLQGSAELELYDLQLQTATDLLSVLLAYTCHSVCFSCFGPSFNACEEFIPLVNLQTTLTLPNGQSQSFTKGDRAFRGRSYDALTSYAVTAWFKIENSDATSGYCEVLRLTNNNDL